MSEEILSKVAYRKLVNDQSYLISPGNPMPVSNFDSESPYSELLMAQRSEIFSLLSTDPLSILRDVTDTTGTGAVTHEVDEYRLNAPAASDEALLESAEIGRYIPGASAEGGVGLRLDSRPAGSEIEWGLNDGVDGFRFRRDDSGLYVEVLRQGSPTISVERADFNVDKLDGLGPSGIDLSSDPDAFLQDGSIWQIRFSWYGYGVIEWRLVHPNRVEGISDDLKERQRVWTLHRLKVDGSTSVRNPSLPVRVAARDGADVYVGGRQFAVIGAAPLTTARVAGDYRQSQSAPSGTFAPAIAIRRNPNLDFASAVKILTDSFSIITDNNTITQIFVAPAGAVGGGAWVQPRNMATDESAVQVNRSGTSLNLSGAIPLGVSLIGTSGQGSNRTGSGRDLISRSPLVRDLELILAVQGLGALTPTVNSSLNWLETR